MIRRAFVRSLSGAILCTLLGVKPWRLEEEPNAVIPVGAPLTFEPGTLVAWIDANVDQATLANIRGHISPPAGLVYLRRTAP